MLAAVGQAFFSLSLGVAGMMTYGAYASRDTNLAETSGIIAGADTAVAMLAGCIPVTTRAGSLPEVAGDCGIYVDTDDPAGIARPDHGLRRGRARH